MRMPRAARFLKLKALAALAIAAAFAAPAPLCASAVWSASFAPIGQPTSVPFGWADFCRRYTGECDGAALPAVDINLSGKSIKEIERINRWVNEHIEPVSDSQHWGTLDQWDYPTDGRGDCEDFALLKRKLLIDEGFPRQALLMTIVKDAHDDGHAILTVKTNAGEFVLDNLRGEIRPWDRSGYRFVKRQSQNDQNVWVQIGDPTPAPDYVSR